MPYEHYVVSINLRKILHYRKVYKKRILNNFMRYTNTQLLSSLLSQGRINANNLEEILDISIKRVRPNIDKIEGMLLGVAIGDSLGNAIELIDPNIRLRRYGFIEDYVSSLGGKRMGFPSDDTQLTFDTVKVILEDGYLNPEKLVKTFFSHEIYGIGISTSEVRNRYLRGMKWYECGVKSAGNGALMRISPVILPSLKGDENHLVDAVLDTIITHNDALAIGTSIAFAELFRNLVTSANEDFLANLPERIYRFVGNRYYKVRIPNANLYELLTREIDKALKRDEDTLTFCERVGSEAYLGETLPCVLFIVKKFRENPQRAILEAVNYTWDSDTIASIVGAIMGAIYGKSAFRKEWIDGLSGRLLINGKDGVIFEMIDEVKSWLSS